LHGLHEAAEADRREMLVEYVRGQVGKVLRHENSDSIGNRRPLMDLGIDSLMAVQLRNLLGTGLNLKQPLPATLIFNCPTIEAIATCLEKQIFGTAEDSSVVENATQREAAAKLARLSDDQVADILPEKLQGP
jgi:hypothetical protein